MRLFKIFLLILMVLFTGPLKAESAEPSPHEDDEFDLMNILAEKGLHDLNDERWNIYGQMTWIQQQQSKFNAPYTNLNGSTNSLLPYSASTFTVTSTLYFGLKLWEGGEIYVAPEAISSLPLSDLKGLGSTIQNFELQKNGAMTPRLYNSRSYFQQTFNFGGGTQQIESDPMQLGKKVDTRRLSLTVGEHSVLDFFDKNAYSGDLRRQFFNMAFLTYAAYDFAADARGYTFGANAQLFWDDWAFRFGRVAAPIDPNQQYLNYDIFEYYGDQLEVEHAHMLFDQPGVIRVLGFRNQENMAKFSDAIAAYQSNPQKYNATSCTSFNYGSNNSNAPDLCWARKPNIKMGIGINFEQQLTEDLGVFFRGMYNDGQTEVYSFTSTDRSISIGGIAKGSLWDRKRDSMGIGYAQGWISKEHAQYLAMGGIDGFIGDGAISQASEHVIDIFYSANLLSPVWFTADFQYIANPAYNSARGPLEVYGGRLLVEF